MARKKRPSAAEIATALGATTPVGTLHILFFVPSLQRTGEAIDHDFWVREALDIFGRLFRGATAYPRARGVWRDDERGELEFEQPTIVFTYANPADFTAQARRRLRVFLHRVGRQTNQGEVGIVIDGRYYGITDFDDEDE